jgi:CubicO group peptidase (beta-lactamase class C family)
MKGKMSYNNQILILGLIAILIAGCAGTQAGTSQQTPVPLENASGLNETPVPRSPASTDRSSGTDIDPTMVLKVSQESPGEAPVEWQTASPESQGMDSTILSEMFAAIEESRTDLHSLMIWRDGSIVLEAYFYPNQADDKHVMFSVTKSVMATLTGIALGRGYIESVDQKIVDLLPEASFENQDPRKGQVTLENVLTMTSGLGWEEADATFAQLYSHEDWVEYVLGMDMIAGPGLSFNYCSGCSHILSAVIQDSTGQELLEFARESLFEPLAISDFSWETDRKGLPIGGWGLELTTRDMAKLGILYLHQGRWDGIQIVPPEWTDAAVEFHTDTGDGVGYGYQWWVYPDYGGYAALGRGGQTVFVIPDQKLIIATTAELDNHAPIFDLMDNFILPAILSDQALPPNTTGEKRLEAIVEQIAQP